MVESLSFFGLPGGRVSVLLLVFFPSVFLRGAIFFSEFDGVSACDWSLQVMDLDFLVLF